jgi:hypothetical protein
MARRRSLSSRRSPPLVMMIMQTTKNKFGWPDLRMEHSSCLGSCLLFILIQLYLLSRGLSTSMNSLNVKLVDLFLSIHLWFYLILLLEYVCPVLIQKVLSGIIPMFCRLKVWSSRITSLLGIISSLTCLCVFHIGSC